MSDGGQQSQLDIERERIELKRYKIRLDYKKFVLGSVFVALALAAIPPLFQLATAGLEYVKSNADRQAKQQTFRDEYIKDFVSNALNQDIELRIRFAQYFARVSTSREDWAAYLKDLKDTRDAIRTQIDKMETQWSALATTKDRNEAEIARLERNLAWAYKEVGYVERNRSAAVNPRAPELSSAPPANYTPLLLSRFADPVYFLTKAIRWEPKADQTVKFEPVEVPAGFVVTFDIVPRVFWSVLRPDSEFVYPAVIHEYLYWTQSRPRSVADEIFKLALNDFVIDPKVIETIYQAVRFSGQAAWDENVRLKAQGEKRVLKEYPPDARTRWTDWKKRSDVFTDAPSPVPR